MKKSPFTILCRSCDDGRHECDPSAGCQCPCKEGRELQQKINAAKVQEEDMLLLERREIVLH